MQRFQRLLNGRLHLAQPKLGLDVVALGLVGEVERRRLLEQDEPARLEHLGVARAVAPAAVEIGLHRLELLVLEHPGDEIVRRIVGVRHGVPLEIGQFVLYLCSCSFALGKRRCIPLEECLYSLKGIPMAWEVEVTEAYEAWWQGLTEQEG